MVFMDTFLPEFEKEMGDTRSILERVPDSLLDWKAEDSLNTIRWNASHLADTLSWVEVTMKETSFDIAPQDGEPHETPLMESTEVIINNFDANLASAIGFFREATDAELAQPWSLLKTGEEIFTMPRNRLVRVLFLNHMIHHRAFLNAYLRINGVACPGIYG